MAFHRLRPSLLEVVMVLMFGTVIVQVQCYTDYELCKPYTPTTLRVNPASPPFNIKSPDFGVNEYPNNLNCSFAVESGIEPLVLLFFYVNFNVEPDVFCLYDSLCVNGVLNCGSWQTGFAFANILPAFKRSTIVFKTDGSIRKSGFKITVIPQPVVIGQTVQEAKGIGSNDQFIYYTANTFSPRNVYTDECASP